MGGWLRVQGNMSRDILAWVKELPDGIVHTPLRPAPQPRIWSLAGMQLTTAPRGTVYIQGGRKVLAH